MTVRLSPSGQVIEPATLAGQLRWPTIIDTSSSGVQTAWVPVDTGTGALLDDETVGVRSSPPATLILHGMVLEDGQEVTLRVGRASGFNIVIVPESTLAAQDTYRFATPNQQVMTLRRADAVVLRSNEGRIVVEAVAVAPVITLGRAGGIVTATNATTELSVASTVLTFPANTLQAANLFYWQAYCEFVHTAAATPLIDVGFSINGAAPSYASITPAANAGTFQWKVEGYARVSSLGGAGAWRNNIQWKAPFGATVSDQMGGAVTLQSMDSTAQTSIELRMRMQSAVASNTLSIYNACVQQFN